MLVGSLFSGIGGMDLGLERAGMEVIWQVEMDQWCQLVLAKHWPEVKRYGDIKTVSVTELEPVDLLCGGFPCQPSSHAGKRQGQQDDRWLWGEFFRFIRILEPTWVLVENVPGLLSVNSGAGFGEVVRDLASVGYSVEWDCIPAATIGAPHRRDRVWIVAHSNGIGTSPDSQRVSQGESEFSRRGDVSDSSEKGLGRWQQHPESSPGALAHTASQQGHVGADHSRIGLGREAISEFGNGSGSEDVAHSTIISNTNSERREESSSGRQSMASEQRFIGRHSSEIFHEPSPTKSTFWESEPDVGRVADGVPRRMDRLRGLGNAVVPQLVEFIGRRIMMVVEDR